MNVAGEQEESHIERDLEELEMYLLLAISPQSKGRFEKILGLLQDRFIYEL